MWLRRLYWWWLLPAALILPLWLLVAWAFFSGAAAAFLWVLLLAMPSVFFGQLILALLVRARPVARADKAVSWWDVAGFTLWNGLTIALGFFDNPWWPELFVAAIVVGVGMFWLELWQLWREAKPSGLVRRTDRFGYTPEQASPPPADTSGSGDVYVITEQKPPTP